MARTPEKTARAGDDRRQKLWRELALVAIAPLLLYLLASLASYSTDDPGWSRTGSVTGAVAQHRRPGRRLHGRPGLLVLRLCGLFACRWCWAASPGSRCSAWIRDGDGRVDFGPALRLIGIVGFLVSASGLLHLLGGAGAESAGGSPAASSGSWSGDRMLQRVRPAWAATCSCSPCS